MLAYFAYLLSCFVIIAIIVLAIKHRCAALCVIVFLIAIAVLPNVGKTERVNPDDVRTVTVVAFKLDKGVVVVKDEDGFVFEVPFAKDNYVLGEERVLWVYENMPLWLEPSISEQEVQ